MPGVTQIERIGIVGATTWGRTLARLFASRGHAVLLWARDQAEREHAGAGLVGIATVDCDAARLRSCSVVVYVVPSSSLRWNLERTLDGVAAHATVLSAIKGIEVGTGRRMSEIMEAAGVERARIAVLSGPNLSAEIEAGLPAATVVAAVDEARARAVQALLNGPTFRVYTNDDVIGVEMAGALKNIVAIAAGVCDGLGFGTNARAGLMTRALAEITRLGVAAGARPITFLGLAGIGDLIATCESGLSRNKRLGLALGAGKRLDEALAAIDGVVEGVSTTAAAVLLARRHRVEMPITAQLHDVLYEGRSAVAAMTELMGRAAGPEFPPRRFDSPGDAD